MMTFKHDYVQIYVWIWLPDATEPIVAGKLEEIGNKQIGFTYGQSYLENPKAIPIYNEELPLIKGIQIKEIGKESLHGCIRDASPDSWGRKVIVYERFGRKSPAIDTDAIDEFVYLMESGSDRIGALDFQLSHKNYAQRPEYNVSLDDLHRYADAIEKGEHTPSELSNIYQHLTAIGGAHPKAFLYDNDKKYIAKFSSIANNMRETIKAEFVTMRMARLCGIDVANVELTKANNEDVLLVERFDRVRQNNGWSRKLMLSAQTLLGLDKGSVDESSYEDFAEIIRHNFTKPKATLRELFSRLVFNILCGNTDDHARNHAGFWDGANLTLTPAYDIYPYFPNGETNQSMFIIGQNRTSKLTTCLETAYNFMLNEKEAREIIDKQIETIKQKQKDIFNEAELAPVIRESFESRLFLNEFALEGY